MDHFRQDLQYATRRLAKAPGFTVVAAITLALGIGANTAIFSVVNGVLLQPLPYPESARLVGVYHVWEGHRTTMSGPNFIDVVRGAHSFENAAAYLTSRAILTGEGEPARLPIAGVSASLFDVLRTRAAAGRTFTPDEDTPGKTDVVVLSHALWRERFGGDPNVVGRRIVLDGVRKEVIGVAPAGFAFPAAVQAWVPIEYDEDFVSKQRGAWYLGVVARLKPGISPAQAAAEVEALGRNLARQYPDANARLGATTYPLLEAMVVDIRRSVLVLLGAVGFVLLIACANVANLLLARAAAREPEMAVRTALGAGRARLVRQLLTESVLLALVGGAGGLLLAVWGVELLAGLQPQGIPRLENVRIDGAVMAFTAGLALVTGLVFGLVPAFSATRAASVSLKEGGRGSAGGRASARVRGALVVAELALAVMLLAGAGLLLRSFVKLRSVDPGFQSDRTLTFELTLPDAQYADDARRVVFFDQLLAQLRAVPGVRSASAVLFLPLTAHQFNISFLVVGRPPVPPAEQPAMQVRVTTSDYFAAVGIPVKRGRAFSERDAADSPRVVVITEAAAKQFFPGEDPIGKVIRLGWGKGPGTPKAGGEVVGIVGDVKEAGLDEPNAPQIFLPYRQWPVGSMAIVLKTSVPAESVAEGARAAVHAVDPNLPLSSVRTLDAIVAASISQQRFYMLLLAVFAGVALALAAIGIFGVLSYAVSQRTREIGVRMALGAQEGRVVAMIVREAMTLASIGVATGIAAALLLTQTMTKMLFSTDPTDPATFLAVAAVLIAVALVASYLPARRATRVDPVVALRAE